MTQHPGEEPGPAGEPSILSSDPDPRPARVWIYVLLTAVLAAGAVWVHRVEWFSGPTVYTVLESVGTALAFVIGILALVRYYSKKRSTYLFIGTGFLGAGFLETYHVLVTSPWMDASPELTVWTWVAARAFLALFLLMSWVAWYQETGGGAQKPSGVPDERSVYVTAAFLTVVIFLFFTAAPLADAYQPGALISRPPELIPAFFFLLALVGYLTKGHWRSDPFEHWLVIALILSVVLHGGVLSLSGGLYDAPADLSHLLKLGSYGSILSGLMASFFVTLRREAAASEAVLDANQALAHEVRVRRRAEHVLQESEERLQDFLDNAHDLIQSIDPDGKILYANKAWRRTLGYGDEELEDLNIFQVIHRDSKDRFREMLDRVFDGHTFSDFEVKLLGRGGTVVRCSGSFNARFENGRPSSARSILRDVTEERRIQEELTVSQANLETLFESTGDAIWSVGPSHRLITFNTAYALTVEAITGREPQVGDPLSKVIPERDREWFAECYDRALAGNRFSAVWGERVAEEERSYDLYFNPIQSGSGVSGVVVFSKDITRRLRVEEALRRAKQEAEEGNQAKSQFMANMSHELRTPLNSVIGFANILLKDKDERLEASQREFLERILANGKHLLGLINEILDLSKIEAGRMEVDLETVNLPDLLQETISQLEGQVAGRPVELRIEVPSDLAPVETDRVKLKQVLINLVGNALKFTEEGHVALRVEADPGSNMPRAISVEDTGPGIPDDRLEAIFDAFQQVDGGTARRFGGTGLGLTISRSLCQLLGYRLTAASEVGHGSTFTVELDPGDPEEREGPRQEGELRRLDPPVPRGADLMELPARTGIEGRKILVVDDEADSRRLLEHYLEEAGCQVVTAKDGVEGLEVARRERPDLITVDLMMPRMSGWDMLRAVREEAPLRNIPVVVVSIVAQEGSGRVLGAVDLLDKPVDRDEFLGVLRRNLVGDVGRVLVVEDDRDTRRLLRHYLQELGLVVYVAENGERALELLRGMVPDLILLDLRMPVMDGPSLLERLRSEPSYASVPVVVLTAKDLDSAEAREISEEVMEVIPKVDRVEDRLATVIDRIFGTEEQEPDLETPR